MTRFALYIRESMVSIAQFFLSFAKIIFISKWFVKLPPKNGNEIAYLANGPSLQEALEKMKAEGMPENIMVSNSFGSSDLYTELKPNFYIACDPNILIISEYYPQAEKFHVDIFEKTTWELTVFIPFQNLKQVRQNIKQLNLSNPNVHLCGYNVTNFNGDNWFNYLFFKKRLGVPRPTTVAVPALMLCMNMGYKKVKIAGIDLNQYQNIRVDAENRLMLKETYFYSNEEKLVPFYKNKKENTLFTVSEIFLIFHRFFYSFDIIAKFASYQKVEITNYSKESSLDQFKKI